jgi:23S rRNA (uracil1939-C5)-methyltransferase
VIEEIDDIGLVEISGVGIEYIEAAIKDANENSALNDISNTHFFAGDMHKVLNDAFIEENGRPDVIVTDPPRAGMHEKVVKEILKIAPEKVVYVSCNPATQARDLAIMASDYRIEKVQPVDMFPQTHHVENVVLLKKLKT